MQNVLGQCCSHLLPALVFRFVLRPVVVMPRQPAKRCNFGDLMQIAVTSCRDKHAAIQRNLGDPSSQVWCKYLVHALAFVAAHVFLLL